MDYIDNSDEVVHQDEQIALDIEVREPWRHFERHDPFVELNDREFRLQFRFSKDSVDNLVDLVTPHFPQDDRRHVLTPLQNVLVTLSSLAGDEFQRTSALLTWCCQKTVSNCVTRTFNALEALKPDFVYLPTQSEMQDSANEIRERFNLDTFPYGIDCVHMIFREKPRNIVGDNAPARFYNRKGRYSLNVQVIGDAFHRIRDIDVRYPGCAHDSTIWNYSSARNHLMRQPYHLAGDAGYPLSETLIKPFAEPTTSRKRLFNHHLSQACVVMTEDLFGIWKRRFPVLTNMRYDHLTAMKAVVATAVLMNFAKNEGDDDLEDFPILDEGDMDIADLIVDDDRRRETVQEGGSIRRDHIVATMLPPQNPTEWDIFGSD